MQPLAASLDMPFFGELAQHALECRAVGILGAEGARDLARRGGYEHGDLGQRQAHTLDERDLRMVELLLVLARPRALCEVQLAEHDVVEPEGVRRRRVEPTPVKHARGGLGTLSKLFADHGPSFASFTSCFVLFSHSFRRLHCWSCVYRDCTEEPVRPSVFAACQDGVPGPIAATPFVG